MYPPNVKARAREAYVNEERTTWREIADLCGIRSAATIKRWAEAENWDEAQARSREIREKRTEAATLDPREQHVSQFRQLWNGIMSNVAMRLAQARKDGERVSPGELDYLSRVLNRAQDGQEKLLRITAMREELEAAREAPMGSARKELADMTEAEIHAEVERLTEQLQDTIDTVETSAT